MPIHPGQLTAMKFPPVVHQYSRRDTQVYALALNYGSDPLDAADVAHVLESGQVVAPTMPLVMGVTSLRDMNLGINFSRGVHAGQTVEFLRPLPPRGSLSCSTSISDVRELGPHKGAMLLVQRDITSEAGDLLARCTQKALCRADGGFGGQAPPATPGAPMDGEPELDCAVTLLPQQALPYRLCGDLNPLPSDPQAARAAGFSGPILHGLASFGILARELIRRLANGDTTRFSAMAARFTSPVYPGQPLRQPDTLAFKAWQNRRLVVTDGTLTLHAGIHSHHSQETSVETNA
jgi:acyl dehydratase